MNTSTGSGSDAFAVWLTGRPGAGKSTITVALTQRLADRGVRAAVLESDELRKILTPQPTYSAQEREVFYSAMAHLGLLLVSQGVPVIFDATAHRRAFRDRARTSIAKFIEVHVDCPLDTVVARDPKGIYRRAIDRPANAVPGLQVPYEPPLNPDVVVQSERESSEHAAAKIVAELERRGFLPAVRK